MESFIGWIGGKRALRRAILERFPDDEVGRYIEVFGGAAWVLFAKEKKANQLEVYNDINGNLVNLFRCVKYHCGELQRELEWMLTSREQFFDCLTQYQARGLTDIQRQEYIARQQRVDLRCPAPAAADRPLLAGHCRPDAQALQRLPHSGFLPG